MREIKTMAKKGTTKSGGSGMSGVKGGCKGGGKGGCKGGGKGGKGCK
jgi:hypothetical protein